MIRRSLTLTTLAIVAAFAMAGCSSSPAATGPGGGTPVPGQPTPVPGQPTPAPVGGTGHECDAIPTLNALASATPAMPVDQVLLGKYPTTVAGQPVTNAEAVPFVAFICELEGQAGISTLTTESSALGVNFANASYGSFDATVNDSTVNVSAIRFPGEDANSLVQKFSQFGGLFGATVTGALSQQNIGGKNVYVSTEAGNDTSTYLYVSGDTLFTIDGETADQVTPVLQALP